MHCVAAEIPIAQRMLQASGRQYSVLLVAVDLPKKELDKHALAQEPRTRQSIPGKLGNVIKFRDGLAVQCASGGCAAPQPSGLGKRHKVEAVFAYPPSGQRENVTVQWVDRLPKESDKDHMARASRLASIGLACHGNRLGYKAPITSSTKFSRIWLLKGCPRHWDMTQVVSIVQERLRQNARGGEKTFLFRGAAHEGADCDLIPITAQDGEDSTPFTLWACVAPARQEQLKQKRLRNGYLPLLRRSRTHSVRSFRQSRLLSRPTLHRPLRRATRP